MSAPVVDLQLGCPVVELKLVLVRHTQVQPFAWGGARRLLLLPARKRLGLRARLPAWKSAPPLHTATTLFLTPQQG